MIFPLCRPRFPPVALQAGADLQSKGESVFRGHGGGLEQHCPLLDDRTPEALYN